MGENRLEKENDRLTDVLSDQNRMTSLYNDVATECANLNLKKDMIRILEEEQNIQSDIFYCMQQRGLYRAKPADMNEIQKANQKFSR
jgi:hypothetical protein